MPDIDYSNKTDRDLLVEVVVTTNGISQKLDIVCDKVEVLEKEHVLRIVESPISRKAVAVSAGAGGGIVGLLVIIAQTLIDYFK